MRSLHCGPGTKASVAARTVCAKHACADTCRQLWFSSRTSSIPRAAATCLADQQLFSSTLCEKKNRYVHVNQGLEEQEDKDSFHVLWAGAVVGSVSGQRFRNCCNCAAAWLFGLQFHSSICTCRHEDTDLPSHIICSVQLSVLP